MSTELTEEGIMLLAREAVDWIAILQSKRRPIPTPRFADEADQREKWVETERYQLRLKSQAYDLAMALNQIFNLLRPLEDRLPAELNDLVARFLSAMRSGQLVHLRDAMEHRDAFLSGTMERGQKNKKIDSWEKHQDAAIGGDKAIIAGTRETYEALQQGWAFRFDGGGVAAVALLGRNYLLLDAFQGAVEIGPPLGRWCGRLFVGTDGSEEAP